MHCCCSGGDPAASAVSAPPASWPRRIGALVQWALPLATIALIPKCPACVAAYVLLFTGIGLSFPAAAAARWVLLALSIAALAYLSVRFARRASTRRAQA